MLPASDRFWLGCGAFSRYFKCSFRILISCHAVFSISVCRCIPQYAPESPGWCWSAQTHCTVAQCDVIVFKCVLFEVGLHLLCIRKPDALMRRNMTCTCKFSFICYILLMWVFTDGRTLQCVRPPVSIKLISEYNSIWVVMASIIFYLWPLLLIWFNLNASMYKKLHTTVGWN